MSEALLLSLVRSYPNLTALARKTRNGAVFPALRSLEHRGIVRRYRNHYRLTRRGRDELAMACVIARVVSRAEYAAR